MTTLIARLKLRGDTLSNWTTADPLLADREVGIVTDSVVGLDGCNWHKAKIGPGYWSALPFMTIGDASVLQALLDTKANTADLGSAAFLDSDAFDAAGAAAAVEADLGTAAALDSGTDEGDVVVLGSGGKLPSSVLPALAITDTFPVSSEAEMLALTAEVGDVAVRSDLNKSFILRETGAGTLANWSELLTPTDAVLAVAGLTGSIAASDLRTALELGSAALEDSSAFDAAGAADTAETNANAYTDTAVDILKVVHFSITVEAPTDGQNIPVHIAAGGLTINSLTAETGGTVTVACKIGTTDITGLGAVAVSGTQGSTAATADNVMAAGDVLHVVFSSPSSAAYTILTFTATLS
jgi:hypothetical protein